MNVSRELLMVNHHIATLAVFTDDSRELGWRCADPICESRGVVRAVERGADVVAHATVNTDVES